ncbi:phage/plasmid primase, P4 family [uncultured Lactobacillus sp.]|uniref:phage/plasmid primase, P4 family n=1 Tax=uncultured Lactobacillus sp. TaxID=153152 RepID=UPI002627FD91|nr:phage/plasmid primase, P4 family [uncultured Lactobacillus sp.]
MPKFNYQNIPQELRNLKQWGLFELKWVEARKKNTKIPINPYDGSAGKSNDPNTWSDFDTAMRALNDVERADGLAFYFANGYVGLDIDHIDSNLEDWRAGDNDPNNLVNKFQDLTDNTYMEVSQSGTGIHAIFKGKIPGKRRRKGNYEMYQTGRFFALTGNNIIPDPTIKSMSDDEMKTLYEFLFGKDNIVQLHSESDNITPVDLSVAEIIKRAENSAKTGTRFTMFMKGGWEQFYSSHSEADMAFANDLAFWTGRDFHKMDTIFRNSSLMREKFDEKHGAVTYGTSLLNKAINETQNIYNPESDSQDSESSYTFSFNEDKTKKIMPRSWDDQGRGLRMRDQFATVLKFNAVDKKWFFFNGSYWQEDIGNQRVELVAERVANSIKKEKPELRFSTKTDDDKAMNEWYKFQKDSRSHMAKMHMIDEFKKYVIVKHGEFDKEDMLLNTESGYVDLSSGELHDHDIDKKFSHQTVAEYSDNVDAPLWEKFLNQIFNNDEELIHYVQKAIGYSFTGSVDEQCLFILNGRGRNGKSVFSNVVSDVAGNYAKQMNVQTIVAKKNQSGSANSDIARLEGARIVTSSELNEGDRFDESLVKQLTGGDKILARFLYGSEFEYKPKFKIWMATNHLPIIRGTDDGIWRRIKIIPFNIQIPKEKVDKKLEYKLKAEYTGILNWIVQGAIMWQQEGLEDPEAVTKVIETYRAEMDPLDAFLEECCTTGQNYSIKAREMYDAYHEWAKESEEYKMSMTKFGREMGKKLIKVKRKDGLYYVGLKLKEPDSDYTFSFN